MVEKFPGANTLEVTRGVEDALDALRPGLAGVAGRPDDLQAGQFIETAIDNLTLALVIASAPRGARARGVPARVAHRRRRLIAIVLSRRRRRVVLVPARHDDEHAGLGGLVRPSVVVFDDAIAAVENIGDACAARGEPATGPPAATIPRRRWRRGGSLAYATVILLLALVPVFFLQGVRARSSSRSRSLWSAVLASLLVALTVTPRSACFSCGTRRSTRPIRRSQGG